MDLKEYFTGRNRVAFSPRETLQLHYQNIVGVGLDLDRLNFNFTGGSGFNRFSFSFNFTGLFLSLRRGMAYSNLVNWAVFQSTVATFNLDHSKFALVTLVRIPLGGFYTLA